MRGFTLLETLLVLLLLGVLWALGLPRLAGLRDRLIVEAAAARLMEAYEQARVSALLSGAGAVLEVTPGQLTVSRVLGEDTVAVWRAVGPAGSGVRFSASRARVSFGANGMSYGFGNGRFELSRGAVSRALIASRPGRLRVERGPRRRGRTADRGAPRCRDTS